MDLHTSEGLNISQINSELNKIWNYAKSRTKTKRIKQNDSTVTQHLDDFYLLHERAKQSEMGFHYKYLYTTRNRILGDGPQPSPNLNISVTKTYCHGLMKPWPSFTVRDVAKGIGHSFLSDRDHMISFFVMAIQKLWPKVRNILLFISWFSHSQVINCDYMFNL